MATIIYHYLLASQTFCRISYRCFYRLHTDGRKSNQQSNDTRPIQTLQIFKFSHWPYSLLKLFTGFAIAAFIAWKLTVAKAINITNIPADANIHQLNEMRYG